MASDGRCEHVDASGARCGRGVAFYDVLCPQHCRERQHAADLKAERARIRREEVEPLLEALSDLREATTDAYKIGRIPAEPFVRAGNVLADIRAALRSADERGR